MCRKELASVGASFESNVKLPNWSSKGTVEERLALARSEAERIAAEHGVPCFPGGSPESHESFHRYGLACSLDSRCNPFGIAPAGYYDNDGNLKAVRYPIRKAAPTPQEAP